MAGQYRYWATGGVPDAELAEVKECIELLERIMAHLRLGVEEGRYEPDNVRLRRQGMPKQVAFSLYQAWSWLGQFYALPAGLAENGEKLLDELGWEVGLQED